MAERVGGGARLGAGSSLSELWGEQGGWESSFDQKRARPVLFISPFPRNDFYD